MVIFRSAGTEDCRRAAPPPSRSDSRIIIRKEPDSISPAGGIAPGTPILVQALSRRGTVKSASWWIFHAGNESTPFRSTLTGVCGSYGVQGSSCPYGRCDRGIDGLFRAGALFAREQGWGDPLELRRRNMPLSAGNGDRGY